jgi:hypothetical protein
MTHNPHRPQISSPSDILRPIHKFTIQNRLWPSRRLSLPKMSELSNIPPVAHRLFPVLRTAVGFGHNEGLGLGIIQRAATGAARSSK